MFITITFTVKNANLDSQVIPMEQFLMIFDFMMPSFFLCYIHTCALKHMNIILFFPCHFF